MDERECVDLQVLSQLHAEVGHDAEIIGGLLTTYCERASELVNGLAAATTAGDTKSVRSAAHDLRSMSGMVGAVELERLSAELEELPSSEVAMMKIVSSIEIGLPVALVAIERFVAAA